jgi:hypothetical protein
MPIHLIYVPGLGDRFTSLRQFFLRFWRLFGVTTELVPMNWSDGVSYQSKFDRLSKTIDDVRGKRIVLIGESAGGSIVLNMYQARPNDLYKVMTICGKNTAPNHVSPGLYHKNPAFKESMYASDNAVKQLTLRQRQNFISIHPIADAIVPVKETLISDCQSVRLWSVGHFITIAFALTLWSWYIVRLAKRPLF